MVVVALSEGIDADIDLSAVPSLLSKPKSFAEIADDIPLDDAMWCKYDYIVEKEKRSKKKGDGYRIRAYSYSSDSICTVTKGHWKVRISDPFIEHPTKPAYMRKLTTREQARVKSIPDQLAEGFFSIATQEIFGQSVCYGKFLSLSAHLGRVFKEFVDSVHDHHYLSHNRVKDSFVL